MPSDNNISNRYICYFSNIENSTKIKPVNEKFILSQLDSIDQLINEKKIKKESLIIGKII